MILFAMLALTPGSVSSVFASAEFMLTRLPFAEVDDLA